MPCYMTHVWLSPNFLSFVCLNLIILGNFVYQDEYVLMKFGIFNKIKSSHSSTKNTLIILFHRSHFIILQVRSIKFLFGDFIVHSLYSCEP